MNNWQGYTKEELKSFTIDSLHQQIYRMGQAQEDWKRHVDKEKATERIDFLEKEIKKIQQELSERKNQ